MCFAVKNTAYGLVAQLGERRVRIAEVEGSTPFRSTITNTDELMVFACCSSYFVD